MRAAPPSARAPASHANEARALGGASRTRAPALGSHLPPLHLQIEVVNNATFDVRVSSLSSQCFRCAPLFHSEVAGNTSGVFNMSSLHTQTLVVNASASPPSVTDLSLPVTLGDQV